MKLYSYVEWIGGARKGAWTSEYMFLTIGLHYSHNDIRNIYVLTLNMPTK
jgi:hypothetical protein